MLILEIAIGVFLGIVGALTLLAWLPGYLEDRAYKKQYRKATGRNPW